MELLVKFIATDSKAEAIDHAMYVNEIFKKVHANGLIRKLMVSLDELQFKSSPVRQADEDGNLFVIEFNSSENGKSDN